MWYLIQLYENDEKSIKEVLSKIYNQFETLPDQLKICLTSRNLPGLAALCHKMSNSALMVGSQELQRRFIEIEDSTKDPIDYNYISELIDQITKLLPETSKSISEYLQYFD